MAADGGAPPATRVRGPRWKDARLIVGLLLVLVSVAVGARMFATADRTTSVWAATRDLDSGTVLTAEDITQRQVRLLDVTDKYLAAETRPVGYTLVRAVGDGELVPSGAVRKPGSAGERRLVTLTVARERLPARLSVGNRVDVFVTAKSQAGADPQAAEVVVSGASVTSVDTPGEGLGSAAAEIGIEIAVAPDQVAEVINASRHGDIDLVKLPLGAPVESTPTESP